MNELKALDMYHCRWRDGETGFAKKTGSLMKMTTPQEKIEFLHDPSPILKYYFYPVILNKNDSLGFELLKKIF